MTITKDEVEKAGEHLKRMAEQMKRDREPTFEITNSEFYLGYYIGTSAGVHYLAGDWYVDKVRQEMAEDTIMAHQAAIEYAKDAAIEYAKDVDPNVKELFKVIQAAFLDGVRWVWRTDL